MPKGSNEPALNDRAQHLLRVLVDRYIRDGQPVGSRTLSRDSGLELSPATIRNVISDLEDMGLVRSPHTSAGRIPTVQGYRLFVDSLLKVSPVHQDDVRRLREMLDPHQDAESLVDVASNVLSEVTRLAGLVRVQRQNRVTFRQVEFLPLSDDQVLVILVVNEREVQNRIIRSARRYKASELVQAANYLNESFAGRVLEDVREVLLAEMRDARESVNRMMMAAIEMADKALVREDDDGFVVAGQTNLMEYGDLSDMDRLRDLFEAFNRRRDILHLLDECLTADGLQIYIGEESGYEVLDNCSVVTAPYHAKGEVQGVLGVIGPTRMAYERIIPVVELTAELLGTALNQRH